MKPPVVVGSFTFWGAEQGLSAKVSDVSADEAGNVYVAAGDAVFAKTRDAQDFTRFDADRRAHEELPRRRRRSRTRARPIRR